MVLLLHLWLPCIRLLPCQDTLFVLLKNYLHFERAWNPSNFEPEQIPEIHGDEYSLQKLLALSDNGKKPVIVRGFMNSSKAFSEAGRPEWVQKYQDFNLVEVFLNPGEHWDHNKSSIKWVRFPAYVEKIQQDVGGYAFGMDEMLIRYPEIYDSLDLQKLQVGCRSLSLQVNGQGEGLKYHIENHPNFVHCYHGSKTWEIINYRFSIFFAPRLPSGSLSFGYYPSVTEMMEWLPKSTIVLNPGDSLYNPPWSWHKVRNTADKETKLVVAAACRWSDVSTAVRLSSALELHKSFGWEAFLHPSMPLWLRWVPFFRVLQDGFRESFSLLPSFGEAGYHEDCFSSKAKACEAVLKKTGFDSFRREE